MAVKIVTDSTSDIPKELAENLGLTVVPLNVNFGTDTFKDNVTISGDDFYKRLTSGGPLPSTSQPSPGEFLEVYDNLGKDADAIVSVHVSATESGTYNSAIQAKAQTNAECPIEVIDSEQFSMGLGLIAIKAAEHANQGAGFDDVVANINESKSRAECIGLVDTLDYLVKGGRAGKIQGVMGSLLKIKPMIIVKEGQVQQLGKERTFARAVSRIKQVAASFAPLESMAVLYSTTPVEAQELADSLSQLIPEGSTPYITRFGPVIGTYTGPGALGIAVLRATE